ncbi:MAG: small ribosomal subunit Rsm22 family protein, partial [Haloplanus sp.]
MIDREAVRSNAKYLRQVRPIDPDEIADYIEGTPHPAAVRQVLREEAYDLGLFERDDGTFVPASDDPVPSPDWRPDRLPERYAVALEDRLVERYGANWHRGDSGDHLREVIRRLKADYYRGNPVEYDSEVALGYAIYHLPDYYAAVGYPLDDLTENGLLPRRLRVLDVGAGVGGPALGLFDYLPEDAVVDYHAVEPSAAADVLDALLDETRRNVRTTIHREPAEAFAFDDDYDLVICANVLSELDDPVAVLERALDSLTDDGTALALAPADLETSTGLRQVERTVAADGATVYAPTLRLWPGTNPADRGWSFDERPPIEAPAVQRRLDDAGDDPGTFRNETVKFSYALLRTDGERRVAVRADPSRHARMADMERHVTERIDLLAVKLSRNLADGDEANPLFKIGDGSERVEQYAVSTRESTLNRDLLTADYGAVLQFENALALWNDDEGAYNLV